MRNVDKIKSLEKELGKYQKKVADQGKLLRKLRDELERSHAGAIQLQAAADGLLTAVALEFGEIVRDEETGAELEGATYSVGTTVTVQLPGHAYLMVPLTMEGQDTPYQRQYLRKQGDYLINIMLFSSQEGEDAFSALVAQLSELENPS